MYTYTKLSPIADAVSQVLFKEAPSLWRTVSNLLGLAASMADFAAEREDPAFALIRIKGVLEFDDIIKQCPFAPYPRGTVLREALDLCADHDTGEWNDAKAEILCRIREMEARQTISE